MIGPSCDSTSLAMKIMDSCGSGEGASSDCCEAIITAVDTRGCLCHVTSERFLIEADISLIRILQLYNKCGGVRILSDDLQCEDVQDALLPMPPNPKQWLVKWLTQCRCGDAGIHSRHLYHPHRIGRVDHQYVLRVQAQDNPRSHAQYLQH